MTRRKSQLGSSKELLAQAQAAVTQLAREPRKQLAVVTCMDARIDPFRIFSAVPGEINVIRNAGGIVTDDVVRSLLVSQHRLGTRRIDLVMHTDCGMLNLDEAQLAGDIQATTGEQVRGSFGSFSDLEAELARGVGALRSAPGLLHRGGIRGHVFDVTDGRLMAVVG